MVGKKHEILETFYDFVKLTSVMIKQKKQLWCLIAFLIDLPLLLRAVK